MSTTAHVATSPAVQATRFAESIIKGNPSLYQSVEVQGVREFEPGFLEVDNKEPEFFTVYLRESGLGRPKGSLLAADAVGDFPTYEQAMAYAKHLGGKYGWPLDDFYQVAQAA
ncbi:hypothetical protein [Vogesella indigofera]|uniref:Uncharacterized protein n=1 Tax=Vogesella indigofera TaxID=45465 RepID=A0ABT5I958_VOGIN|nr:hypothetical protein [Vogesella indigofera]MDC7692533.1 hypothetical protein [Vogesella indigofera]